MKVKDKVAVEIKKAQALLELLQRRRNHALSEETVERVLQDVVDRLFVLCEDAVEVEKASPKQLALRRFIPLLLTVLVSLGTSTILSSFHATISKCAAAFAFAPLVSAVCGNYGLQTAAITIRAIAVRTLKEGVAAFVKELITAAITGLLTGAAAGLFALLLTGDVRVFFTVILAMTGGVMTAASMGYLIPLAMHKVGVDPALVAGPGETTFQDLVSYSVYLLCLKLLFGA